MNKERIKLLKNIGENIQNCREAKGLTLKEVSEKTGIRKQYLKRIEKGEAPRITTTIYLIAVALKVYPHELFNGLQ